MKIYSSEICPFVQRVTALLEARNLPYEIENIDLGDKPDWFLEISPLGQVPVLVADDGRALHESDAIVEYIEETAGEPLFPGDPVEKAQERAWSYLATKNYLVQCSAQRSPDRVTFVERATKLKKAFAAVEKRLGDSQFFSGDKVGMVDIAWLPLLHRAAIIQQHSGYDFLAEFPKVKAWQQAICATGLPEKSVAEDFVEKFTNFYLSSKTYLGQQLTSETEQVCCGPSGHSVTRACCC
ncbi:MAG: glutathione S-transferase family protein [Woeseia sp.]